MHIRSLTINDEMDYRILIETFRPFSRTFTTESYKAFINDLDRSSISDSKSVWVMEADDSRLVGMITVIYEYKLLFGGSFIAHIEDVCTLPEYRHLKIGSRMVQHALEEAKQRGCYKCVLTCDKKVMPFYLVNGFEERGQHLSQLLKEP
jgi:ribosomal protein S18 acetylase RimI-like enzyme